MSDVRAGRPRYQAITVVQGNNNEPKTWKNVRFHKVKVSRGFYGMGYRRVRSRPAGCSSPLGLIDVSHDKE